MINVTYKPPGELLIEGHSRTVRKGTDIVCAGVSAIAVCVDQALGRLHLENETRVKDGFYRVKASGEEAELILFTAACGLEEIARLHPEAVKINDL